MHATHNPDSPKKATNLSINGDLLLQAKKLGINLSATLEHALVEQVKARQAEDWLKENRKAIAAYNKHADECGTFGDKVRNF